MHILQICMDDGGAIGSVNSETNNLFVSKDFGGCSAIYAKTENGFYGLYHLRSTLELNYPGTIIVKDAKDSNEPFRKWIYDLYIRAKGKPIHFFIGTPHTTSNDRVLDNHPYIGMERYLRKICSRFYIPEYDITLLNMQDVVTIEVSKEGIKYFDYCKNEVKVDKSKYQTDEEAFAHSHLTDEQCLACVTADPNIDWDGTLKDKYQMAIDFKKIEMDLAILTYKYKKIFDKDTSAKNNKKAFNYIFVRELYHIVQSGISLEETRFKLESLKNDITFKLVTQTQPLLNFLKKFKQAPRITELGLMFNKVDHFFLQKQQMMDDKKCSQMLNKV